MKNKILLILFITLISNTIVPAQTYIYYGDKTYGTDRQDNFTTIIDVGNGHLMIGGNTNGNINGDKTEPLCDTVLQPNQDDIWILKIDTAFNIIWDKSVGGAQVEFAPHLLLKKNTSQIMITCSSLSDSSCEKTANNKSFPLKHDYWIANMDTNGILQSDFTWGGNLQDWCPQSIRITSNNYITCGLSTSSMSGDVTISNYDSTNGSYDYWVVKTDSSGNKIWDNHYGGSGNEAGGLNDPQFSLLADNEDDFILAGTTSSPVSGNISDSSKGMEDIWIIKIDSAGNKIWDKRYGGSGYDICERIIKCNDGGYMLCGSTNSPKGGDVSDSTKGLGDCWVIKLDTLGNKQWDKRYGGNKNDIATWIERAPGGGYWAAPASG